MNMKKIVAAGLAGVLAVSFAACSNGAADDKQEAAKAKTGYAVISEIKEDEYNKSETALEINSVIAAVLVDEEGKVVSCKIDEAQTKPDLTKNDGNVDDLRTKLQKQGDYGMKETSANIGNIAEGGEWFEQAAAFEAWTVGKTADEITAGIGEDGYASDADLKAGCTIHASGFVAATVKAINEAKDLGASTTDTLAINVKTEKYYESNETNLQYDSNYAIVTLDAEGKITSCIIDASQAKCSIADGKFTVEKGAYPTKKELGNDYGMKGVSAGIGVIPEGGEWFEQAAAFEAWAVGKTADEVKAGLGEDGKAADADLAAGCTITVSSIIETVAAAATK